MQTRLETLRRLVSLFAAVEEMHSTELRRTTAAVREAQQVIRVEQEVARAARIDGRGALLAGDRVSWMMAEAHARRCCLETSGAGPDSFGPRGTQRSCQGTVCGEPAEERADKACLRRYLATNGDRRRTSSASGFR